MLLKVGQVSVTDGGRINMFYKVDHKTSTLHINFHRSQNGVIHVFKRVQAKQENE